MLGALLTILVMGVAGVLAIGLVLAIVGFVFSLVFGVVGFLLFKVAPVVLIGWLALKLVRRKHRGREISAADQRWLDGG